MKPERGQSVNLGMAEGLSGILEVSSQIGKYRQAKAGSYDRA